MSVDASSSFERHWEQGMAHRARHDLAAALAEFTCASDLRPDDDAARCEVADVLRQLDRHDEAKDLLRGVLSRRPAHWQALVGLGLLARQRGDHAAAAAFFRQAGDNNPEHPGIQLELGLSLRSAGLTAHAAEIYRAVLDRDPGQVDALVGLALVLRQRCDSSMAVELLRAAVDRRPDDPAVRLELAAALRELSQLDAAEREYGALLARNPDNWMAWVGRALVARQRGDHAASHDDFTQASFLQPAHPGVQNELALTLRLLGRLDEAEALYRRLIESDPVSGASLHGLSLIALQRGEFDAAVRWARVALDADPGNADRLIFLAALNRDSGRLDEAETWLAQCLASAPNHADAWLERGLLLRARNQRAAALAAFERAAAGGAERGLTEAAAEHRALGNPDQARAVYQRLLDTQPQHLPALLGMAELEMLAANYARCIERCDALIAAYPRQLLAYRQKCRALIQLDRADEAVHIVTGLAISGPLAVEADAARLEIFRTCGMRREAQALLALPRVAGATAFGLWFERLLTQITFHHPKAAAAALDASPAVHLFERSRVLYGQGMLADLEWRVEEAIEWFERALALHADDPGAHHQLARLKLLRVDPDGVHRHLQAMIELSGSALRMRGESTNVSQNLIGQLVNELRLDTDVLTRLGTLRDLEPHARIDALVGLVRASPQLTPPAMGLMLALRQSGAFQGSDPGAPGAPMIPRKIMQYWDQTFPAHDIARLLRTWVEAHPGYAYCRFDDATAREYLAAHHPKEVLTAYRHARHPAQASDLFRLAYLRREGGFYIDADDRCVGHLSALVLPGIELVGYQEQYATLGNNFLGCLPGEAVIDRAFTLAVETLNRGDSEAIWLATGPGLVTRAFTEVLAAQGADWRPWLGRRRILDRNELSAVSWSHSISQYKNTRRSWLRSAFKGRTAARASVS